MFIQTEAFVLHRTPYNDNYSILHLFTKERGRIGALMPHKKGRRKKSSSQLNNLTEIDITLQLKPNRDIAYIKEFRIINPNHSIQLNPYKCSQGIFISELLYRTLKHPESDIELYNFLSNSFKVLNDIERGMANFYLCFTYKLLDYFAVTPLIEEETNPNCKEWFDMENGTFLNTLPASDYILDLNESKHLRLFARMNYRNLYLFKYNRYDRGRILNRLMQYYQLHIPSFRSLKSINILRSSTNK